jgi:hypothetical protein
MVALRRSAAGARTTALAVAWLERDEAILVNLRGADECAREIRGRARALQPDGHRDGKRLVVRAAAAIANQSHGQRFDNLFG